jgi:hypothetical protein
MDGLFKAIGLFEIIEEVSREREEVKRSER